MFKNEEMKARRDLTSSEWREIIVALDEGKCECYDRSNKDWYYCSGVTGMYLRNVYRVKPTKEDNTPIKNIPWDFIDEKYSWCAMDSDGLIFFFEDKPFLRNTHWDYGGGYCGDCILKVDTTDVVWNTSLTKRP